MPADQPQYAFAAVYEGEVGSKVHGGTTAAPMIADIFKQVYKTQPATVKRRGIQLPGPFNVRKAQPVEEDESN